MHCNRNSTLWFRKWLFIETGLNMHRPNINIMVHYISCISYLVYTQCLESIKDLSHYVQTYFKTFLSFNKIIIWFRVKTSILESNFIISMMMLFMWNGINYSLQNGVILFHFCFEILLNWMPFETSYFTNLTILSWNDDYCKRLLCSINTRRWKMR